MIKPQLNAIVEQCCELLESSLGARPIYRLAVRRRRLLLPAPFHALLRLSLPDALGGRSRGLALRRAFLALPRRVLAVGLRRQ